MSHRTVSWTRIDRAGRDSRPTIPAGLLGARAIVQLGARTRPLVVAGCYDRAAIMAAACKAATGIQERCGVSRAEAMSSALTAAWQVATSATLDAEPASTPPSTSSLVGMLDLASASMRELQAIRDVAERVGSVAYTHAWSPRCQRRAHPSGASNFNAAGKLVQWIGDALTAVESAAEKEAAGRTPSDQDDRETRLSMLAVTTIDNGDPDEIEAFARELLAHAEAERRDH